MMKKKFRRQDAGVEQENEHSKDDEDLYTYSCLER